MIRLIYPTENEYDNDFFVDIIAPILEEIIYRWAYLELLRIAETGVNRAYTWYSGKEVSERVIRIEKAIRISLTALLFSYAHRANHNSWREARHQCVFALMYGLTAGSLFESTKSILPSTLIHNLDNSLVSSELKETDSLVVYTSFAELIVYTRLALYFS